MLWGHCKKACVTKTGKDLRHKVENGSLLCEPTGQHFLGKQIILVVNYIHLQETQRLSKE